MRQFETDRQVNEWSKRILKLTNPPRMMTLKAAMVVVDAAMFGEGCIEGKVRARIQAELEAEHAADTQEHIGTV